MRKHTVKSIPAALAAFAMMSAAACTSVVRVGDPSVTGDPCSNADWFEVGRLDGINGIHPENSKYAGSCKAQGKGYDIELYTGGWNRGLVEYCTPERGFDAGRAGEEYAGICPSHVEAKFLERYKVGQKISEIERENARIDRELGRRENEVQQTTSILDDALARLPGFDPAPSEDRRKKLQAEIDDLKAKRAQNDDQIRSLEASANLSPTTTKTL